MPKETPRNTIWNLVREIGTCMMVTYTDDHIRARPMRGLARPEQNAIWFFTDEATHKDDEVKRDPRACLTFSDNHENSYASLSGHVARVRDRDTINDLWTEGARAYFPKGPDDPQIVLLRFTPETGEYWDAPSSPILVAIKFLEAQVTGERPVLGTNETVTLA